LQVFHLTNQRTVAASASIPSHATEKFSPAPGRGDASRYQTVFLLARSVYAIFRNELHSVFEIDLVARSTLIYEPMRAKSRAIAAYV